MTSRKTGWYGRAAMVHFSRYSISDRRQLSRSRVQMESHLAHLQSPSVITSLPVQMVECYKVRLYGHDESWRSCLGPCAAIVPECTPLASAQGSGCGQHLKDWVGKVAGVSIPESRPFFYRPDTRSVCIAVDPTLEKEDEVPEERMSGVSASGR
jgi:hypothetical protein